MGRGREKHKHSLWLSAGPEAGLDPTTLWSDLNQNQELDAQPTTAQAPQHLIYFRHLKQNS